MAEVVKTVGTDGGRDFASLASAISTGINNTTFPTAGTTAVFELYTDTAVETVTAQITISNSASNVDNIIIRPAVGHEHLGVIGDGYILRGNFSHASSGIITFANSKGVLLQGITVDADGYTGDNGASLIGNLSSANATLPDRQHVDKCIVTNGINKDPGTRFPVGMYANARPMLVTNSIVFDISGTGATSSADAAGMAGDDKMRIYNNTVYDITWTNEAFGISPTDSTNAYVKNNAVTDIKTDDYGAGTNWNTATNVSEDTTGTSGLTGNAAADLYTDSANLDFSIKDTDSALYQAGTDLSGEGDAHGATALEYGIDGVLRTGTWHIGAFAGSPVATTATPKGVFGLALHGPLKRNVY